MTRIIVIGGGIAGLSAAAELSKDADVTLLEGEDALGYHASGRSAALIEKNYGAPSVQALNHASFDLLADGGYLSPRGLLVLAKTSEQQAFRHDLVTMSLDEISVDDARNMVPVLDRAATAFAGYHADAWDIDTDRLLQDHARQLRTAGGRILTGHTVTEIAQSDNLWCVNTGSETFLADIIVNAAGAWADQVAHRAGIAPISIQPLRRSMARIPAPDAHEVKDWPMFFGVGESWYAKPDAGALLVSPADEEQVEPHDAWADDLTLAEGIAQYEAFVTCPVKRLLASWAGLRSFAPDKTLVLGREPSMPSFVWCAGQGGYGFQTSPAAARLLADLIFDRTPDLPEEIVAALRPERLR